MTQKTTDKLGWVFVLLIAYAVHWVWLDYMWRTSSHWEARRAIYGERTEKQAFIIVWAATPITLPLNCVLQVCEWGGQIVDFGTKLVPDAP